MKIKNIKQHAHEVLKKNIDKAEVVVKEIQSQWETQLDDIQKAELNKRIENCKNKIEKLKTKEHTEENMLKLLQEINKLKTFQETLDQPILQRFDSSQFDENDPNLITEDLDENTLACSDKILSELEEDLNFECNYCNKTYPVISHLSDVGGVVCVICVENSEHDV
jgi:hypothetical protein